MILVKHTYRVFEFKEHNKQLRTRIKIKKGQVWNARSAVHIHTAHGTVREREGRDPMSKETSARKQRSRSSSRDPWKTTNSATAQCTARLIFSTPSAVIISMRGMSERQLTNSKSPSVKGRCILTGFSLAWAPPPIIDGWTAAAAAAEAATGAGSWLGAAITVLAITPTVEPIPLPRKIIIKTLYKNKDFVSFFVKELKWPLHFRVKTKSITKKINNALQEKCGVKYRPKFDSTGAAGCSQSVSAPRASWEWAGLGQLKTERFVREPPSPAPFSQSDPETEDDICSYSIALQMFDDLKATQLI